VTLSYILQHRTYDENDQEEIIHKEASELSHPTPRRAIAAKVFQAVANEEKEQII
jgi:hypothetical protein